MCIRDRSKDLQKNIEEGTSTLPFPEQSRVMFEGIPCWPKLPNLFKPDVYKRQVENGDTLAIGGFTTNRKPYATVSEILRQGQEDFIVYAGPGGGEVDMLIGEGRVAAYINCYTANSGYTTFPVVSVLPSSRASSPMKTIPRTC